MSDNTPGSQGNQPYGQQNQPQYGQNQPQYGQNQPQYGQSQPSYGQSDGQNEQTNSPYGQSTSPYGQQGGNNYPGQQGYQGQPAHNPGKTLGIVGFILAIFIAPVGLIISIIAFVKSRKAKMGNGFALAGIIIGVLFTIIGIISAIAFASLTAELAQQFIEACQGQPAGTPVTVEGQTIEC